MQAGQNRRLQTGLGERSSRKKMFSLESNRVKLRIILICSFGIIIKREQVQPRKIRMNKLQLFVIAKLDFILSDVSSIVAGPCVIKRDR